MAGPQRRQLPAIAFDGIGDKLPEDECDPSTGRAAGWPDTAGAALVFPGKTGYS
jgi:hypothetical protein